jgi:hypothetical protein
VDDCQIPESVDGVNERVELGRDLGGGLESGFVIFVGLRPSYFLYEDGRLQHIVVCGLLSSDVIGIGTQDGIVPVL